MAQNSVKKGIIAFLTFLAVTPGISLIGLIIALVFVLKWLNRNLTGDIATAIA